MHFSVLGSTRVETDRLPVLGKRFRYWEKGERRETGAVQEIERPERPGYSKTYQFRTQAAHWRVTITDPIFHGT